MTANDWEGPDGEADDIVLANNQWSLVDSRFGVGGTWLRFFSQAPELDPEADNTGGVRAIGYQLVRYGLTGSKTSKPRYQLFRSDVTAQETFEAGYDLDPIDGAYGAAAPDGIRVPKNIITPIFNDSIGPSTDFSLAANVIDFGIRAYLIDENDEGTGHLRTNFPGRKRFLLWKLFGLRIIVDQQPIREFNRYASCFSGSDRRDGQNTDY